MTDDNKERLDLLMAIIAQYGGLVVKRDVKAIMLQLALIEATVRGLLEEIERLHEAIEWSTPTVITLVKGD